MRFCVVGVGAIGGLTGASLVRQGEEVQFVDASPEQVAAINRDGLVVEHPSDGFTVRGRAYLPEELRGPLDVVLLAVKSQHTVGVIERIAPQLGEHSLVVSLQNGLNPDWIAHRIGADRTAGACVNFGADLLGPGRVRYGHAGEFYLGQPSRRPDERVVAIGEKFGRFMRTTVTDNIMGFLWSKLCDLSVFVGTALVDATIPEVLASHNDRGVLAAAAQEAVSVAHACGVRLEPFDPFDPTVFEAGADPSRVDAFFEAARARYGSGTKLHSGFWRDLRVRKRGTEVQWLTGELVRRGEEVGHPAPINARMVQMIREIEDGQREQSWENLAELRALHGPPTEAVTG